MILTTALFGIKEAIMLLVIIIAISYFTVKALTAADNKDRAKAMKDPINDELVVTMSWKSHTVMKWTEKKNSGNYSRMYPSGTLRLYNQRQTHDDL